MKVVKKFFLVLAIMFLITPAFAAMKVKFFVGDAQVKTFGSETWGKITMNQALTNGDVVKTGAKAYVQIDMGGNMIKVNENTELSIGSDIDGEKKVAALDMKRGTVQLKMDKLRKSNKGFKVNTVSTVCAVRGTEFLVASGYDGTSLLQVQKGRVALTGTSKTVMVNANQEASVPFGGEPSEVREITINEWNKWIDESKKRAKGNEKNILEECLNKLKIIDKEIIELEEIGAFQEKEKMKYDELAKKYKAEGNNTEFKENAKLAFKAGQKTHLAFFKTSLKAYKMTMIHTFAIDTYDSIESTKRTSEINTIYKDIDTIYNKYYIKYIKEAIEAKRKLDERRKKKK